MKRVGLALVAAATIAAPALADVKAGVDAWQRGDFVRAVAEWRDPATAGDADAQYNMGQAYKLGRGVPQDRAIAIEWFRKAAARGHQQAEDNLGLALFDNRDFAAALPLLERSAARDERRAQLVLGTMLFNGDGATKDWTRAYALVTRASQQGLTQASRTLAQMDQFIPEVQRQEGIALANRYAAVRPRPEPAPAGTTAATTSPAPRATPRPAPAAARTTPRPASVASAAPAPARAATGRWRVQLGAFRDEGNARALWASIGPRVGGSVDYVRGGGVVRVQATGFASRSAASAACARARATCVVVAP